MRSKITLQAQISFSELSTGDIYRTGVAQSQAHHWCVSFKLTVPNNIQVVYMQHERRFEWFYKEWRLTTELY